MPEAAIGKNDDALAPKDEIRLAEKHLPPAPAVDAVRAEEIDHSQFSTRIATKRPRVADSKLARLGEELSQLR